MPASPFDAKNLIQKYKSGICTPEEQRLVEQWYDELWETRVMLDDDAVHQDLDEVWLRLIAEVKPQSKKKSYHSFYKAAAILITGMLLFGGINYFYKNQKNSAKDTRLEIMPDGDFATLTSSDGLRISLDSIPPGDTLVHEGIRITKTAEGHIVYQSGDDPAVKAPAPLHEITTPKGGQYSVTLSDGTRAWLNAASSLSYPRIFSKQQRAVSITGEVYFEVAENKMRPFKVSANGMEVKVLGTHFNVSAYANDKMVSTTLFEGAVALHTNTAQIRIHPGQTAVWKVNSKNITTVPADLEGALAWKNGYFVFNEEHIQQIMEKLSRWYNVTVIYQGDLSGLNFSAKMPRKSTISEVLSILQATGTIHFKIEGRRVIVSKKSL